MLEAVEPQMWSCFPDSHIRKQAAWKGGAKMGENLMVFSLRASTMKGLKTEAL